MNSEIIESIKTATQPIIDLFLQYGLLIIGIIGITAVICILFILKRK